MKALFQYIRLISLLIFTTILLTACEREIEIPLPDHEAKLVGNCIAVSGQPFRVLVSRSFGMDEQVQQADIYLTDAEVVLWKDGEEVETLQYVPYDEGPGAFGYYAEHLAEPGSHYELHISHPDFPPMYQEMTMPAVSQIEDIQFIRDAAIGEDGYPLQYVRVRLKDPADVNNYYSLSNFYPLEPLDSTRLIDPLDSIPIRIIGGSILQSQRTGSEDYSRFLQNILSDETFDGQEITLTFEEETIGQLDSIEFYAPSYMILRWSSWNEPAYRLGVEYSDHVSSRRFFDLDLSVLTKSPLPIYSNAEGGFGIFGGFTMRTDTLFFE